MNSMPGQRGVTEFQSKRNLSNPNPNVERQDTNPNTTLMGISWNSGGLT